MSTRIGCPLVSKKISSWVRPGVCEVRASALRPVSALIRLDLPTLERPANAISMPRMAGNTASEPAAATKRHSLANSLRPRSISSSLNGTLGKGAIQRRLLCWQLLLSEQGLDVVEQLNLGAVAMH